MMNSNKKLIRRAGCCSMMLMLGALLIPISHPASGSLQVSSTTLTPAPSSGAAPLSVEFAVQVSGPSSSSCTPDSYVLNFGDGSDAFTGSSYGPYKVKHVYAESGNYTAKLIFTRFEAVTVPFPDCRTYQDVIEVGIAVSAPANPPAAPGTGASGAQPAIRFTGSDGNWFNPANWEGGRLPGQNDDVLIGGSHEVVIDPDKDPARAQGRVPGVISVNRLTLEAQASLIALPGSEINFQNLIVGGSATLTARSSLLRGQLLRRSGTEASNCPVCIVGNPSLFELKNFEQTGGKLTLYLGGVQPASAGNLGPGHYAAVRAERVTLDKTNLGIDAIHGFVPRAGDTFIIVQASTELKGRFANAAPGELVARFGNTGLYIEYNEKTVVLTARAVP